MFWELPEVSLLGTIRVFCSDAESRFGRASFRTLRLVLWLFTSCVWDVLRYRILGKKQLLIFSETWSSSFWVVCNRFDDFRTNCPKNNGQSHRKDNTNFAKWRWVRSKNVCLSSALLFSLVVTKKYDLRTSWGLSIWNKTCFLFRCRVTFRPGKFSNATFGTLALYILRLRCLGISNTYKNSFWFFRKRGLRRFGLCAVVLMIFVQTFRKIMGDLTESKTSTFQNDVEYVPKMSVWALLCFFLWL